VRGESRPVTGLGVNNMYILGINFLGHNASACLIKDGQVIGAAEEDKFDRIKNSRRFPANSIKFCLSKAGITAGDVDHIAFSFAISICSRLI